MNEYKSTPAGQTARRIYFVDTTGNGLYHAHWQPLNKKTGKPWQATRRIMEGRNAYRLGNWQTGEKSEIQHGGFPDGDWTAGGRWNSIVCGFLTLEDALAAVEKTKALEK